MMMFSSGTKVELFRRIHDDLAAGQAFADVIVGVAFQGEGHALGHERAEALAGAAGEMNFDGVFRQTFRAPAPGDFAADDRADDAVDVADGQRGDRLFLCARSPARKACSSTVLSSAFSRPWSCGIWQKRPTSVGTSG